MKKILIILSLVLLVGCTKIEEKHDKKDYKEQVRELLEKSYTYSLFAYGKNELEDKVATLDNVEYSLIKNDNIKTLDDLNNQIEDIFVLEKKELFYESLYSKKDFIEIDSHLYVNINEELCEIEKTDFTEFNISKETDEYLIIDIKDKSYYVYIRDNKLYLSDDVYSCPSNETIEDNDASDNLID